MVMEHYPGFIQDKLETMKKSGGVDVVSDNQYTYVLLALGERRTGGYDIKVLDVSEAQENGQSYILVKAKEIAPGPGDIVIQVITYPVAVYRIPKTGLPVRVKWVRQH
ncbi:protease complex subunit PrcB family protein [Caldalkalibacillus salinus]|uniref:protease complex subunit PrcB family protein n=1 Tax=Caldalkalibacillus salinus TaxID=2803787 RepID=UPI0019250946|nr:protease complex subunit PrcB family protein [Caldalkalibacillus salinus]